jgi:LacI family transcriptional regulator
MVKDVTIYDLAKDLGLSVATVSRALKNDPSVKPTTKHLIIEHAEKRGYQSNYFARSLRQKKTYTIGVIMHELNSHFMVSVLAGIEKVFSNTTYDIIIAHSAESEKKEKANANNLFHKRIDGLLASLAFDTKDLDHFEQYFNKNVPVVYFDRVEENTKGTKVIIDNFKAGLTATNHLIQQGCKRIAHVTGSLTRNVYKSRYEGYVASLKMNKIPVYEKYIFISDLQKESCVDIAKTISNMKPMPDGIFITNDISAAIIAQSLKELKIKIPEKIAIVGFNNDIVSTLVEPKISTINYPGIIIGEKAAKCLLNKLTNEEDNTVNKTIIIDSALIIRESSQKINFKQENPHVQG